MRQPGSQNASTTFAFRHECCTRMGISSFGILCFKLFRVAESGGNSAFYNRRAIDLQSSVPWHGVDQFLASKIYPIGFKQPDWRYSARPILSFQQRAIAASETGRGST